MGQATDARRGPVADAPPDRIGGPNRRHRLDEHGIVVALGLTLLLVAVAAYNGWRRRQGKKAWTVWGRRVMVPPWRAVAVFATLAVAFFVLPEADSVTNPVGQVVAGVVLVTGALVLLGDIARSLLQGRRLRQAGAPSFLGGLRYHATGGITSGMVYNATWPFARLDIGAGQVTISLSRNLAFVTRMLGFNLGDPRCLRPDEVDEVETDFGWSRARFGAGGGLRFRTLDPTDERDGTVFWMMPGDRETIIQQVSAAGFRVALV